MKNRLTLIIAFTLCSTVCLDISFSKDIPTTDEIESEIQNENIEEILSLLSHPNWRVQERGVTKLYGAQELLNNERIKLAVIRLLEEINADTENLAARLQEYREKTGEEPPHDWEPEGTIREEGYGELQLYVLELVEGFKDERAIHALVGAIECGAPTMKAVIEFGELAINPLLERLERTKNRSARSSIIKALSEIIKRTQISPLPIEGTPTTRTSVKSPTTSQRELIRNTFIKSLNDPGEFVRMNAIRAIGIIGDTSAIPLLKQIAENDLCVWGTAIGEPTYPVRDGAQRVLKLLEEKKKEEEKNKGTEELKTKEQKNYSRP